MTSKQKLGNLAHQINQAEAGIDKVIVCPYCKEHLDFNPPSALAETWTPPTCCETFALAVIAILQRKEQSEFRDMANRIRDNAASAVNN